MLFSFWSTNRLTPDYVLARDIKMWLLYLSSCVFSLGLSGCGSSIPKPISFIDTPTRLHQSLKKNETQVQSLSGEVSVEIWQKDD
jgi:hypothetical protein